MGENRADQAGEVAVRHPGRFEPLQQHLTRNPEVAEGGARTLRRVGRGNGADADAGDEHIEGVGIVAPERLAEGFGNAVVPVGTKRSVVADQGAGGAAIRGRFVEVDLVLPHGVVGTGEDDAPAAGLARRFVHVVRAADVRFVDRLPRRLVVGDAAEVDDRLATFERAPHRREIAHVGDVVGVAQVDRDDVVIAAQLGTQTPADVSARSGDGDPHACSFVSAASRR